MPVHPVSHITALDKGICVTFTHRASKAKDFSVKLRLFSYPSFEMCVWVLKRTVSVRRFF